jgi:hypothetical protein
MCQAEWESKDVRREAHGNKKLCKDEAEIEWLLDTNKSVWQVYQQKNTPMADGSFLLPSTTVHGNFVFDLALLLSMATGYWRAHG